jgi:hypothetical protein
VGSVNINRTADGNYVVGWSETSDDSVKYVRNTGLSAIKNFGTVGKHFQINNGANYNSLFANTFKNTSQPNNFKVSNSVGSIGKENSISTVASGREGTVYKDNAQFYFTIGDIVVDDQQIDFIDIPDTLNIISRKVLNSCLVSNPFEINDNSNFTYAVLYGITDSTVTSSAIKENDFINFKVELIDDMAGEILGGFDNITYEKTNMFQSNSLSYKVNTSGIGKRTVRLQLLVEDNLKAEYSLTHIYADGSVLSKSQVNEISYKGSVAIESYDLAQNFPNPFNPSTVINYQIPENGMVTLKVYDILGKEVKTLVNEQKTTGRYDVIFDASDLASGVYIYKLQVNDFASSKKMLMIK